MSTNPSSGKPPGAAPAKPGAPVLSLSKLKGKQVSAESIAIHFNAASMHDSDDENYNVLTIETKPKEVSDVNNSSEVKIDRESLSAPPSEAPTPDVNHATETSRGSFSQQNSGNNSVNMSPSHMVGGSAVVKDDGTVATPEKSSLLSGIRERLQDRIPEPFTDFIGKLEKLSGDPNTEEGLRERRLRKGDSIDGKHVMAMKKSESLDSARCQASERRGLYCIGGSASTSRNPSVESEPSIEPLSTPASERSGHSRNNSFELVDDFFGTESLEEFETFAGPPSVSPALPKPASVVKPPRAPKLAKTKLRSEQASGGHSKVEDSDYLAEDEEEFFDPCEDSPSEEGKASTRVLIPQTNWDLWKPHIPSNRTMAAIVAAFAIVVLVLPSFLSGVLVGTAFTWLSMTIYKILYYPVPETKPSSALTQATAATASQRPEMKLSKNDQGKFKGWMNYLNSYSVDDYHISQTQTVYVQLEGTCLRVQRPRVSIAKRAMFDENTSSTVFVHQRHYNLKGSQVYLLPVGLCPKRLWSKKYPIVISLAELATLDRRLSQGSAPSPSAATGGSSIDWENVPSKPPPSDTNGTGAEKTEVNVCASPRRESTPSLKSFRKDAPEVMYLFARTCRQKEEWFRRFEAAAKGHPLPTQLSELLRPRELPQLRTTVSLDTLTKHRRQGSLESPVITPLPTTPVADAPSPAPSLQSPTEQLLRKYLHHMAVILPEGLGQRSKGGRPGSGPRRTQTSQADMTWFNALVGRCLWDFMREEYWAERIKDKIQKKLAKIHVPYFIDELTVCDIDLGSEIPQIQRVAKPPYLDDQGLWLHFDVTYHGGLMMTLETKVNLMKLKKGEATLPSQEPEPDGEKRSAVLCPDEEDSAESSTDEDMREELSPENIDDSGNTSSSKSKKLMRFVDKITSSKYFQQATEYKYIKRAMQGVSNTRLKLSVELNRLVGTLAINIPPPPTDRFWYGFEHNLDLVVSARPKVGERQVTVTLVTDWIQKKLITEFQRVLVMPNMDDLEVPVMCDKLDPFPRQEVVPPRSFHSLEEVSLPPSPNLSPTHAPADPAPSDDPTVSPVEPPTATEQPS